MTIQERLRDFIKYLNISEREFCQIIGVSHAYVQNMRSKVNAATRAKIEAAYPLLNTEWLLTGRGDMLLATPRPKVEIKAPNKPVPVSSPAPADDMAARLLALVESQQKTIAEQSATISRQAATIANLSEGIKKHEAEAPGIPAASVVDL